MPIYLNLTLTLVYFILLYTIMIKTKTLATGKYTEYIKNSLLSEIGLELWLGLFLYLLLSLYSTIHSECIICSK